MSLTFHSLTERPTATVDRERTVSLALLALRVALGIVFVMHGWQKMFVFGHAGLTGYFQSVGIPFASLNAVIVTAVEFGGGLALLVGVGSRIASGLLAVTMAVALADVHLAGGFFLPSGIEYVLTLLVVSLAMTVAGPGAYSLDARLAPRGTPGVRPSVDEKRAA